MKCAWSDQPKDAPQLDESPFTAAPTQWGTPNDRELRRWLSVLVHGSLFFSSAGISLVVPIVLLIGSKDWVVRNNAKEVLNLQISLIFYGIGVLALIVLMGGPAIILVFIMVLLSILCPILAIIHCLQDPDTPFAYPYIMRPLT